MDGPRAAKIEELPLIEKLSNEVFRPGDMFNKTMFQEYPDLFSHKNIENIRVIMKEGKPISNVNYLPSTISIHGCNIKSASLGGVSTHIKHRGKGYATLLLNDCINKMKNQDIDLLLISGDRTLYKNIGCMPAGIVYSFNISKNNSGEIHLPEVCSLANRGLTLREIDIKKVSKENFEKIVTLYQKENVRYIRHYDKFIELLNSLKFERLKGTYKQIFVIEKGKDIESYFCIVTINKKATICDWAGSLTNIIQACNDIIKRHDIYSIAGKMMPYNKKDLEYCRAQDITLEANRLSGTIRIINFERFMESLRQYFYELYDNDFIDELKFSSNDEIFSFIYKDNICTIGDISKLNDLIFGGNKVTKDDFIFNLDINLSIDIFLDFFRKVFPIPFVDPSNLNYI